MKILTTAAIIGCTLLLASCKFAKYAPAIDKAIKELKDDDPKPPPYTPVIKTGITTPTSKPEDDIDKPTTKSSPYEPEYVYRDEWVPCYDCNGNGNCHYCRGKGYDYVTNSSGEVLTSQNCSVCYGTGRCQACAGNRGHYEKRMYQIR